VAPPPPARAPTDCTASTTDDVTADLAGDTARLAGCYAQTVDELLVLAAEAQVAWDAEQRAAFDARVAALRETVAGAPDGKPRQRAWRAFVRYLQGAIVRDDIALASGAAP
jgi:hypothetical protein